MARSNGSTPWWERFALALEIRRNEGCSLWRAWVKAGVVCDDLLEYGRRWDREEARPPRG